MSAVDPALQLLGLAARAGAVLSGTARVVDGVRNGQVAFALVACDLTATGRDKLVPVLDRAGVRYALKYTRVELGRAVGRSPLAAVGLADPGFGDRLAALLGDE